MKLNFRFSLRTAVIVILILGVFICGGFYFYRSYYQAEIKITNLSSKAAFVKIDWKSPTKVMLDHLEIQIADQEQKSFTFLPPTNSGMDYYDFVVLIVHFRLDG